MASFLVRIPSVSSCLLASRKFLLLTLLFCSWESRLLGEARFVIKDGNFKQEDISQLVEAYVDPLDKDWKSEVSPPSNEKFKPLQEVDFEGLDRGSAWVRVILENKTEQTLDLVLHTDMMLYPLHFYEYSNHELSLLGAVDGSKANNQADRFHGTGYLPLILKAGDVRGIYIKYQRKKADLQSINLNLAKRDSFHAYVARDIGLRHLFLGFSLIILAYNFFFWIKLGKSEYLVYSVYLSFYALTISLSYNLALIYFQDILWRENYWQLNAISYDLSIFSASYFTLTFLKLKERSPLMYKSIGATCVLFLVNPFLMMYSLNLNYDVRSIGSILFGPLILVAGVLMIKQKHRPAIYFSIGWGILVAANAISILYQQGYFFSRSYFLEWIIPIGATIEMLILSFALSDSIQAQQKSDREAIENELKKRALTEARQSEILKFESMHRMRLASSFAHYINNPLNQLSLNYELLKKTSTDVMTLVSSLLPEDVQGDNDILAVKNRFKYLFAELEESLGEVKHAAVRIHNSVAEVRSVSGVDGPKMRDIDPRELCLSLEKRVLEMMRAKDASRFSLRVDSIPDNLSLKADYFILKNGIEELLLSLALKTNEALVFSLSMPEQGQLVLRDELGLLGTEDMELFVVALVDSLKHNVARAHVECCMRKVGVKMEVVLASKKVEEGEKKLPGNSDEADEPMVS